MKKAPYTNRMKCQFFTGSPAPHPNQTGQWSGNDWLAAGQIVQAPRDLKVYKKTWVSDRAMLTTLIIPAGTRVRFALGHTKCRAAEAHVLRHESLSGRTHRKYRTTRADWDSDFKYVVGQRVRPSFFSTDRHCTCTGGIHFYLTKEEARDH